MLFRELTVCPACEARHDETGALKQSSRTGAQPMSVELIVHPGADSAFLAWQSPFIDGCRGFALRRKIKRAPGSATSPNTLSEPDADGVVEEMVASWGGLCEWTSSRRQELGSRQANGRFKVA